ncbi:hypothetical protein NUACC21_36010 [Scytonema sp. NUACC21]
MGDSRHTTVIHGNNSSGKTSPLNAFTRVLYEKFSAAFASSEQLVNKRAIASQFKLKLGKRATRYKAALKAFNCFITELTLPA